MTRTPIVLALATLVFGGGMSLARADCESDMIQLEAALKSPTLMVLQEASAKSVAAMNKYDDDTCDKVIAEAMLKAGMTLK